MFKGTMKNKEFRDKMSNFQKEYKNRPEIKEVIRQFQLIHQNLSNVRYNKAKHLSNKWKNDSNYRATMINAIQERWSDSNSHEHMRNIMIEMWKDDLYANKVMTNGYKYKEYTLPFGKIVKLQGYEPQVLTELLKTYSEYDIVIGIKEMNKILGVIEYGCEGKMHRYYPDFYIKSENKIIEVKSNWTFELHKEKNLTKEHACLQQGFKFEFIILNFKTVF